MFRLLHIDNKFCVYVQFHPGNSDYETFDTEEERNARFEELCALLTKSKDPLYWVCASCLTMKDNTVLRREDIMCPKVRT